MTLQEAVSGYLIKPIRGLCRVDLLFGKAGQIESVVVSHILLCVHDVILVSDSLYAGISIIGYANFTLFTSFGRDDKYTIRALSTINSGGGGIFQDRYALDIVRVDRVQRITVRSVERHSATRSARCVYDETIYYI